MFDQFTNAQLIAAGVVFAIVVIVTAALYLTYRRTRTRAFQTRFGPEYDRAVLKYGSSQEAEAKLADRETRVKGLGLRDLAATERERFVAQWQIVQARFVDYPKSAVSEADVLISALLVAIGYPRGVLKSVLRICQSATHDCWKTTAGPTLSRFGPDGSTPAQKNSVKQ